MNIVVNMGSLWGTLAIAALCYGGPSLLRTFAMADRYRLAHWLTMAKLLSPIALLDYNAAQHDTYPIQLKF